MFWQNYSKIEGFDEQDWDYEDLQRNYQDFFDFEVALDSRYLDNLDNFHLTEGCLFLLTWHPRRSSSCSSWSGSCTAGQGKRS